LTIFEVEIASLLITNGYGFRTPDTPEFKLTDHYTNLECTTIQAEESNKPNENIDFNSKLKKKIREKINRSNLKQEYIELDKNRTILLADITNLYAHSTFQGINPTSLTQ
jgi:predicted RNA-binding protein